MSRASGIINVLKTLRVFISLESSGDFVPFVDIDIDSTYVADELGRSIEGSIKINISTRSSGSLNYGKFILSVTVLPSASRV